MRDAFFPGCTSGVYGIELVLGRMTLCKPVKQTKLSLVFPLPSDFEEYLLNPDCKVRLHEYSAPQRARVFLSSERERSTTKA